MRRAGATPSTAGCRPGDHVCWLHAGEASWRQAAVEYLRDGAHAGERLLYVAAKPERQLIDDLAELPSRDAMLASGQLLVRASAGAYGGDGFDADEQVRRWRVDARGAVQAGYRGLRLASEASSFAIDPEDANRFAAYELLVDGLIATGALSALCGYDAGRLSRGAAEALAFVHPLRNGPDGRARPALYADEAGRWRLSGEVDLGSRDALELALAALPRGADVHLDLRDLGFIDVGGLRALAALASERAPHRVVLHRPPPVLRRMLALGSPASGLELVPS